MMALNIKASFKHQFGESINFDGIGSTMSVELIKRSEVELGEVNDG